jgi:hypothetical protein
MSIRVTDRVSPGSAPRTSIGLVAQFTSEIDVLQRVLLALHLSGEAVPRLDLDDGDRADDRDRLSLRVDGPDVLITG